MNYSSCLICLICLIMGSLLLGGCDLDDTQPELLDDVTHETDGPAPFGSIADGEAGPEAEQTWSPTNLPVDPRNACFTQGRLPVIARGSALGVCTFAGLPSGWSVTSLKDKLPVGLQGFIAPADPFGTYCEYVLDENVAEEDAADYYDELVWAMDASPLIVSPRTAGVSCLSAMPMSGLGDNLKLEQEFADTFLASVGRVNPATLALASGHDVNIFLVDNWAGPNLPALDEHGENLARLLELLTEGAEAAIDIIPIVGLPRMDGDVSVVHPGGGVKGTAPDLSVAFMTAATLHLAGNYNALNQTRSIVNASLGGPPLSVDEYASEATQSLIAAMRTLACLGIPVNIAGGNALPHEVVLGEEPDGLLFPGNLDDAFPAPSEVECISMGYGPALLDTIYGYDGWSTDYGSWQPNAISGVDATGDPLTNGRSTGSQTMIAANGVAAHNFALDSFMLTGTSVSTAVMSAASALEWWLDPSLSPVQLSDAIADSGIALGRTADAGVNSGEFMRMVNICMAIQANLATQSIIVSCSTPDPDPYLFIGSRVPQIAAAADLQSVLFTFDLGDAAGSLNNDFPMYFDMTDAMVNPSPTRPACDNCTAGKDVQGPGQHTAYLGMSLTPWTVMLAINEAYLIVYNTNHESNLITLDETIVAAMNNQNTATVVQVDFEYPNLKGAELQLNYDDDITMTVTNLPIW
ncbi:S8/S53 family peptidase [Enhygromyxa salina]|uniref:Peptidase S8/S53 domain-containing protein n=1 Tax=Enhygromyxa salina TaxID=215803 RepID=A0A2S9XWV3_9BACT|nr:S8/S53 family peptidase [Enhygromyxa salina]PRP97346.1 hypothetical protein ENSA7_66960 [Enhygromyxa salina]